jgi:catechol 2,3-dioxygenase-like lactoylglutathione lyase family enzyme
MTDRTPARTLGSVHHIAYRCLDAEQTLWFYQEVLGLKPAAGLVIKGVPGTGGDLTYMHLFFELPNGEFIAFFDSPEDAKPSDFDRKESFDLHLAFEAASHDDMMAMQKRIRSFDIKCAGPIGHGFVDSIYMYDPNGIQVEITARAPNHDAILAAEGAKFPKQLAEWTQATRAMKLEKFGREALERRASAPRAGA